VTKGTNRCGPETNTKRSQIAFVVKFIALKSADPSTKILGASAQSLYKDTPCTFFENGLFPVRVPELGQITS